AMPKFITIARSKLNAFKSFKTRMFKSSDQAAARSQTPLLETFNTDTETELSTTTVAKELQTTAFVVTEPEASFSTITSIEQLPSSSEQADVNGETDMRSTSSYGFGTTEHLDNHTASSKCGGFDQPTIGTDTINTTPTPGSFFNLPAELRNAVHELIFDVTPHHYLER
ncbi:hypothetical protein LTS18_007041, partial [Coniosporium uncinatum]